MKRSLPLSSFSAPLIALSRWRERAKEREERDAAFEAWLEKSGLNTQSGSAPQQERDSKERSSA